jgi:hypothetical protein
MTFERVMEMNKRRVGQMDAAGVRVMAGTDGGIAPAKPHGLLPVSVAFLVQGAVSTVAALTSAAACGLEDRKGRLRADYDAYCSWSTATRSPISATGSARWRCSQAGGARQDLPDVPARADVTGQWRLAGRESRGLTTETPYAQGMPPRCRNRRA